MREYLWGASQQGEVAALDVVEQLAAEPGYSDTYRVVAGVVGAYFDRWRYEDWFRVLAVEETLIYEEELEEPIVLVAADTAGTHRPRRRRVARARAQRAPFARPQPPRARGLRVSRSTPCRSSPHRPTTRPAPSRLPSWPLAPKRSALLSQPGGPRGGAARARATS